MATRRISAACIAQTSRNVLPRLPRHPALRCAGIPAVRHLSTGPLRYKQEANIGVKRDPAPVVVRGASKLFKDADSAVAGPQEWVDGLEWQALDCVALQVSW